MRKWLPALVGIVVIVVLVVWWRGQQAQNGAQGGRGPGGDMRDMPVPVTVTQVQREDVPIWLDGIGTVQAYNSVTIRPRVDGELMSLSFTEGQQVEAGALLAQIDPRAYRADLDQQIALQAQAEAQLASAQGDLTRYEELVKKGYVSRQQLETQRHTVAEAKAAVKSAAAAVQNARVQLGYTTIRSPIDGIAGIRQVDVGNLVQASSSTGLVVITQVQPISVIFTLPEQALAQVHAAQEAEGQVQVVALDRDNQSPIANGELAAVDNQIDETTGTIKLKATFANTDRRLWPGQFVNVRAKVGTATQALVIPTVAVQRGPDGAFVYAVRDDQTVTARKIETTATDDGRSIVTSGLDEGQTIVTDGQYRLKEGAKIVVGKPEEPPKAQRQAPSERSNGNP
jgi:multidrug efflux system membrane fusion protein